MSVSGRLRSWQAGVAGRRGAWRACALSAALLASACGPGASESVVGEDAMAADSLGAIQAEEVDSTATADLTADSAVAPPDVPAADLVDADTDMATDSATTIDPGTDPDTAGATDTDSGEAVLDDAGKVDAAPWDAASDGLADTDAVAEEVGAEDQFASETASADSASDDLADADAAFADVPEDDLPDAEDAVLDAGPADVVADETAADVAALDDLTGAGSDTAADAPVDADTGPSADAVNPNVCPYGLSPAFFCLKWGVCKTGVTLKCVGNSPVCDYSAVANFEELEVTCDGLDNDCNGLTDDDLLAPPIAKKPGVCKPLTAVCQGAAGWGAQEPTTLPGYQTQESACDGLDNDCDGQTDEMAPAPALLQAGVCAGVLQTCLGAQGWQEPVYELMLNYTADSDSVCDGLDNNCDGQTDEGAVCPLWQLGGRGSGKVALSPDGSQLAWVSMTGVHAADPASGKRYYDHFGHRWEVAAAAFSADGSTLASVGRNDVLRIYPAAYGLGAPTSWPVTAAVVKSGARWTALAFALDGSAVVAGDDAGALWPVALATGLAQKPWQVHAKAVTALAFVTLAQGQLQVVVSAAADGTVVARPWPGGVPWQLANLGKPVATVHGDGGGRVLVVAPGLPTRILDVASGKTAALLSGSEGAVAGRFSLGGAQAWTVSGDGHLQRWEVPAAGPPVNPPQLLQAVQQLKGPALLPGDGVVDLAAGATRLVLGTVASGPRVLHLPNLAWAAPQGTGNAAMPKLVVHPAGLLVGASLDGKLRVWDAKKGFLNQEIAAHEGAVLALTRGPGWLLTGGSDFAVRLWQWPDDGAASTSMPLNNKTFGLAGPWATDLAAAGDGLSAWAAAGAGAQRIGTVGSAAGQKLQAYSVGLGAQVQRVVPSPDGGTVLIALDGLGPAQGDHYRLLQATTLKTLWARSDLPADQHVAAWHPAGKWLALGGMDAVHLVDAASGLTVAVLPGWLGQAAELAWNAQGSRLLGASSDGTARVWAIAAAAPAKLVALWARHCPSPCSAVSLRSAAWLGDPPGGVATSGDDGSLMVWRAP